MGIFLFWFSQCDIWLFTSYFHFFFVITCFKIKRWLSFESKFFFFLALKETSSFIFKWEEFIIIQTGKHQERNRLQKEMSLFIFIANCKYIFYLLIYVTKKKSLNIFCYLESKMPADTYQLPVQGLFQLINHQVNWGFLYTFAKCNGSMIL